MDLNNAKLLQVLPAGVVILNERGQVRECNPAAVTLLGEPLLGEKWGDVIARCFAPQDDDGHEVSLWNGRRLSVQTCSLEQHAGQLVLLYDLTETRELQARMARNERLSSMGKMVASLAHQLRTPLSAAMLYAEHLKTDRLPRERQTQCSEKLVGRLQHLDQQLREMLNFARGDEPMAEHIFAEQVYLALRVSVEEALAARRATQADLRVDWQLGGELQALLVGNLQSLVGAAMNLVLNAMDAVRGQASPTIRISFEAHGTLLAVQVADNGSGFDRSTEKRLKEAFFTTKSQGTGLGLAVVDHVARAHKGLFRIASRGPGQGAVAQIFLPVQESTAKKMEVPTMLSINTPAGGYAHA